MKGELIMEANAIKNPKRGVLQNLKKASYGPASM